MKFNKATCCTGERLISFRDPLKQLPSNMIGHVPRPAFADIEGDDAHRIVKLARHEIVDHGVEVGCPFGGLAWVGGDMPGAALDLVFGKIERPKFCAGERYRLVKERYSH